MSSFEWGKSTLIELHAYPAVQLTNLPSRSAYELINLLSASEPEIRQPFRQGLMNAEASASIFP